MSWGSVRVGSVTLREAFSAAAEGSSGGRSLTLSGQEAAPDLTVAEVVQRHDDVLGLAGDLVPVLFTDKPDRDGYYRVGATKAELMSWQGEVVTTTWTMDLERLGSDAEVDIETRLSGGLTRQNDHDLTGERWDAPPPGAYGYYAGATVPSTLVRTGEDGPIIVYRQLGAGTNPRYGCAAADYLTGRVRIEVDGHHRAGTAFNPGTSGWAVSNGLVRVRPRDNGLAVDAYTGGWASKEWDITAFGTLAGPVDAVTVLRNQPECVVVRVVYTPSAVGRVTVDVTLRRGSRFAELYLTASTSTTLRLGLATPEEGDAGTGYLVAEADDDAGNRYVVGSALDHTVDEEAGEISTSSTLTMDAFVGVEAGGSSAVPGDQAADLMAQYLGATAAAVKAVRR